MPEIRTPASQSASRESALSRRLQVVVCLALFLEGMSSSSINVQVAGIRETFAPDPDELQLAVSIFLIAYAGLLPLAGRLVDHRDRRRVFHGGVALFGAGALVCAVAPDPSVLILGRFLQGAGAALSAPAALALVTAGLDAGAARNRAVATYGAMGAVGFSTGLVLPGFLVAELGWRAGFAVLVPIVAAVLVATRSLPAPRMTARKSIDVVGAVVVVAVTALGMHLLGGVQDADRWTWWAEAGALVVLCLGWRLRSALGEQPAGSDRLWLLPQVRVACAGIAGVFAGVLASMFVLSLALQEGADVDAATLGLLILPQPLVFSLTAGRGARVVARLGTARTLALGVATITGALVLLGLAGATSVPVVVVTMALAGAGLGLAFPAASIGAVDAAPERLRGTIGGLLTTCQNLGGAAGLALVTAFGVVPSVRAPDAAPGVLASAGLLALGGVVALLVSRRRTPDGAHRAHEGVAVRAPRGGRFPAQRTPGARGATEA